MLIYLIQLNKKQAKILMPSATIQAMLNNAREYAIPTAIPSISLLPRGGFWFSIIGEQENILRFISYCTKQGLCINHKIKEEKDLNRIDLEVFNQTEALSLPATEEPKPKLTKEEIENERIMAEMLAFQSLPQEEKTAKAERLIGKYTDIIPLE